MTVAKVQDIGTVDAGSASTTTTVLSVTKTITAGNIIVVAWGSYDNTTLSSLTDNLGNTYTVVESNTGSSGARAGIAIGRITVGGSLTTITCNHGSTRYRFAAAAEYSGAGTTTAVGGGLFSASSVSPGTWCNNKTIPANGAAFGAHYMSTSSRTFAAGSASGSPSTSPAVALQTSSGNGGIALLHAFAGGSAVTGFTGTVSWSADGAFQWADAGFTIDGASTAKKNRDPLGMMGLIGG